MLAAARLHPGVHTVRAVAQALPIRTATCLLAYFHLSIHYGDWRAALGEAQRVLLPSGRIEIWTLGPRHHASSNLARWFPSVRIIDERRFPDPEEVGAFLEGRGMDVARATPDVEITRTPSEWIASVEAGFVSTLQLVEPDELAGGLKAFRTAYPDDSRALRYLLRYDRIVAVA